MDLIHTRKQNHEDYRLTQGHYNYQGTFSYYRAFEHLTRHGYQVESIRGGRLDRYCLSSYDALFINLLHTGRPDFSNQERRAIQDYVYQGGGLFVIADHTNVYHHAERLNPLLQPMGIEVLFHTLVEEHPMYQIEGGGWIRILDFLPHPITEGLRMVSYQTGTAFRTHHAVAMSSKRSFADLWNKSDHSGFYGDWTYNGNPEKEPKGPLAAIAATTFGQGRVVVVGDQNIFGDAWIHFGDNFGLFQNSIAWLARQEKEKPALRERPVAGWSVGLDIRHNQYRIGRTSDNGYYSFFVHLNRLTTLTARSVWSTQPKTDTLFLLDPTQDFSPQELKQLRAYIEAGNRVILTFEANQIATATLQVLQTLAPDFSIELKGKTYPLHSKTDWKVFNQRTIPVLQGRIPLLSKEWNVQGLRIASQKTLANTTPTLLDLRSSWGSPLLAAQTPTSSIDLARKKRIGAGELLVFLQDGFWRNRTLGNRATTPPSAPNRDALRLLSVMMRALQPKETPTTP